MRKILTILLGLLVASASYAAVASLFVGNGVPVIVVGAGDGYITDGLEWGGHAYAPDGTLALPSYSFAHDVNTGRYWIGADHFADVVGGVNIVDYTAAAVTFAGLLNYAGLGYPDGAVGGPAYSFAAEPTSGWYRAGAGDVRGAVLGADAIALTADGVRTVGYNRTDHITFQDDFTVGVDATYAVDWNVATVVGAGTNTVTVRDGWSELVTGAAGAGDMESTISNGLNYTRDYAPRAECVVDLTDLVTQHFHFGFYIGAAELVEIVYDSAVGANWLLRVDDTAGVEEIDSTIVATVDPTRLEIVVDAAGDVTWAIDGVPCTVVGLTNQMTANPHYLRWAEYTLGAVAHTAAINYVEVETLKQP